MTPASAQEVRTPTPEGQAPLAPPVLQRFVEPDYPEAALGTGVEGEVVLELLVDHEGRVAEVTVDRSLGAALDAAAREAALATTFIPAQKDGQARAARILFSYRFVLPNTGEHPAPVDPGNEPDAPDDGQAETNARSDADTDASEPPPESAPAASAGHSSDEVLVRGYRVEDQLARSTAAVTVVNLERASRESSSLSEVLARVEGVNVQQVGGLGSRARFSLAGFDDTQVRFFIDGIPLEYQGYSLGLQNVPLNFAQRIEVYKGVVPVQLGADSLGGAFNLVTDHRTRGTKTAASYQMGSFDTHRLTASARHLHEKSGLFVKAEGFFDSTRNDYAVLANVPDAAGQLVEQTRWRMHDGYRASGGNVEVGYVNRVWADRLLLKAYTTAHDKELQHNASMTRPFGEARYSGLAAGAHLRYEHDFGSGLRGTFVSGYAYDRTDFLDKPACVYDWFRQCVLEVKGRGELQAAPSDQTIHDHTGYLRWAFELDLHPEHQIVMSMAPTFFGRRGEDHIRRDTSRLNPLRAKREVFRWINGLEYKAQLAHARVENSLFAKNYLLAAQSVEILNEYIATPMNSQDLHWGVGDGVRFELAEWALLKASYEYAIRLPEPVELFGNSVQIIENLGLEPERSHNVNLTFSVNRLETRYGRFDAGLTGFYRGAENLILLIGRVDVFRYENAYRANVYGVEGAASWTSPGETLELGLNSTFQEYRNRSEEGPFSEFSGDRIPNRPYFFANAHAILRKKRALVRDDEVSLAWYTRYTHGFFRTWESVGSAYEQPEVPNQLVHTAVLTYLLQAPSQHELSFSLEAQNLSDERTFDFYRVQKPGRSFFFKAALSR